MHKRTRIAARALAVAAAVMLVMRAVLYVTTPFDIQDTYSSSDARYISGIGPKSRVVQNGNETKVAKGPVYFTSKLPRDYDTATVKLGYKLSDDQTLSLGYKDAAGWHYAMSVLDAPFIDALSWPRIGDEPYLYQRNPAYSSVEDFVRTPPGEAVIGVYDYDNPSFMYPDITLDNYSPSNAETVISTPLRGKVEMYVYLKDEPFKLTLKKADLNWYSDPDPVTVAIYRQQDTVMTSTIEDDGNDTDDRKPGDTQEVELQNPGPGLPEEGVYRVVIDGSRDTRITEIRTNLHKVVFAGPLYIASAPGVYGTGAAAPVGLYTNNKTIHVAVDHDLPVVVSSGSATITAKREDESQSLTLDKTGMFTVDNGDARVSGADYFSFGAGSFFAPTPYHLLRVSSAADLESVDYVLTNYRTRAVHKGEWKEVERAFDITRAYSTSVGQVQWMLVFNNTSDADEEVVISTISLNVYREGWIGREKPWWLF